MCSPTIRRRFVLALSLVMFASACAGSPPEVPVGPDGEPDPVLSLGRDVFGARCTGCHGSDGGGGSGPRLAGTVVEEFPDPADQAAIIRDGRGSMPSYNGALSEAQIEAVVRYTREVLG